MTKRKAIEAAMDLDRAGRLLTKPGVYVSARALSWLWEQARIAGLREAAKTTDPPQDNPCIDLSEHIIAHKWLSETALELRKHADKLAKKARAAK